ncbi:MAG: 50S ribosomal protein L10 [Ruminiclostridium sp.]|jgi:large subunit ribosomal protein L10|nr:50S ribosomal protein L10 [Ruminiclostridium sp.]MCI9466769.1 50S ribosomal protein L10 [Ruminiclostridium sp.]
MPNAKILSEKQAIVAELTEKLQNAAAGVIVDYKGITVAEDTELRAKMREAGVDYFVMKNTLSRFAVKNAGLDELCDVLKGTTSIALCQGDPVAAAKVVSEFSKKLAAQEKFTVKAGFVDGKVIDAAGVKALADLPSKEVLVATVLGTLIAPVRGLATVLDANISGLARVVQAIADQKA